MSGYILINGDMVTFLPNFGQAAVIVRSGTLTGSGKPVLHGNKICLEGDEKQVLIPGCIYTTPTFFIPGIGTIKIKSLTNNHKAKALFVGNKPVLLKGIQFIASFSVMAPASNPIAGTSDTTQEYEGYGQFTTTNKKWMSK